MGQKNGVFCKTVLVTGGSRGIGAGIAIEFAKDGYDVAITYSTRKDKAEEVAAVIEKEYGRRCIILMANMEEADAAERIVAETVTAYGRLDVLVNNAGVTMFDSMMDMTLERMEFLIHLNFRGYLLAAQAAANHMREMGIAGNILCITSSRGDRAYPGDAVYGGLKAAMKRAVESMALDFAPYGIRVNCIAPGATAVRDTEQTKNFYEDLGPRIPVGRMGTPEDIGHAAVWLASDKASYITGITLRIDGGLILAGMPEVRQDNTDHGWGSAFRKSNR